MTATLGPRASLKTAYDEAPVEDLDRVDIYRHVIVELPAPWPRDARTDTGVKLPIRVVLNGGTDLGLEIGPYDFSARNVQMLKQAIAIYENGGRTSSVHAVYPSVNESNEANVVDLDTCRHR